MSLGGGVVMWATKRATRQAEMGGEAVVDGHGVSIDSGGGESMPSSAARARKRDGELK
jgi:hypothetical protein